MLECEPSVCLQDSFEDVLTLSSFILSTEADAMKLNPPEAPLYAGQGTVLAGGVSSMGLVAFGRGCDSPCWSSTSTTLHGGIRLLMGLDDDDDDDDGCVPGPLEMTGECLLTVQLSEEECAEGEEDVEFYLLFSGTTQRHLTTTLRVSHVTLQAVCPAHNRGETVQVKLCQARPGGAIDLVAEEHFQFVQDLALDMAHFLVRAAAHKGGLRGAMLLDECQIPLQECERLDETLTLALKHLPLPKGWSVLGTDITTQLNTGMPQGVGLVPHYHTGGGTAPCADHRPSSGCPPSALKHDPQLARRLNEEKQVQGFSEEQEKQRGPHDTLLHFAARQGLRRVALFLLQQPGGRDALRFTNKQGHTPAQLAQKRGHSRLQHLLTDSFENSSCSEEKPSRRCFPGGRALIHHPVLNTYTLTVDSDPGAPPPDLRADVEELQRLIGSHCREKACCVGPAPLHTLGLEPKEEKCSHSTHSSDGWPCPSGAVETVQSEEGAAEGGGDQAAEGVCVGTPQECVALGTISCTEQRLEEADKVLGVVRGEQESSHLRPSQKRPLANHSGAQSQTRSTAQSDCGGEGAMGQSHGVLPTETPQRREGEVGWRMGDLPGREGEEPSSLSAPHIGSSEDGTWVENSERSDMPADSDQGNAQAGREIVQPSESREDPGSHSAQTEAPGSAQLDPEMEESDAASLQTTMVPGPDFDAHRGTASEGGASHDHPQNSSRTEPAPLSVEHASTTGKTALCDEIAKGEVDGFLNEEHRQNLDASKPALVISVPTGEETRNDATPIGQTPSDRDRKSPDDGEVSSPETEPVTGSESQPMTCSTSPPVAGETPSAPSESELPQESRVMNPVEQKPDEPPRPPTALDPTQDHTPSGGHGSQTQEAAAAGPPGSEAPSPHQPLEIEETREECEKLPAASAEGCEGTEPSAPPPPPCGLDCQDDSSETSLDPQTEITTSSVTSGAAPVQIETVVSSDSSMTLDRTSTSDPLNFSEVLDPTSPLDIESGTAMYLAISSPVEVDGGLAQEINCGGPETQSREEPHQEQLTVLHVLEWQWYSTHVGAATVFHAVEVTPGPLVLKDVEVKQIPDECSFIVQQLERGWSYGPGYWVELTDPAVRTVTAASPGVWNKQVVLGEQGSAPLPTSTVTMATVPGCRYVGNAVMQHQPGILYRWKVRRGPEAFCPVGEVCSPVLTEQPGTDLSPEEMCLCVSVNSLPALDSVSDGDSLLGPETDDSVFKQIEDTITLAGDSTSGISLTGSISTDNSSAGDTPPVGGAEEGEKQDCLMEVPECSVIVRTSARALSPTRRHSWEANRNSARESDMDQRSVVQNLEEMKSAGHRRSMSWCPSDVHRPETDEMNARRQKVLVTSSHPIPQPAPYSHDLTQSSAQLSPLLTMSRILIYVSEPLDCYSLEGLSDEREGEGSSMLGSASPREPSCPSRLANEERGSLVSLTEEDQEEDLGDASSVDSQRSAQGGWCSGPPAPLNLTKSVSMSAISPRDLDGGHLLFALSAAVLCSAVLGSVNIKWRLKEAHRKLVSLLYPDQLRCCVQNHVHIASLLCVIPDFVVFFLLPDSLMPLSGTLESSISEEEPGPLRSDSEARVGVTKVSRTFSYLKSKMSKKNKEKDREKNKDGKEKEKWSTNGHIFSPASTPPHLFSPASTPPPIPCLQCNKPVNNKDALLCTSTDIHLPFSLTISRFHPASCFLLGTELMEKMNATPRERPWSTEDQAPPSAPPPRKSSGIMALNGSPLSKSISISNIAGQLDDSPLKALKFLSQSTDSLNKGHKVAESTESLTDEGAELMDSQLLGEFEADTRELEADSWSLTVDKKYLKQLKKDVVKRQDVIYELIQTEMHHVRTLRIMADVYSKGLQKEVQLDAHTVEKLFPMLEDLLDVHTNFFTHLLERKREARSRSPDEGGFVIRRIGDILLAQVTGSSADRMKRIYGKFCSRHNEAVNLYKELHTKDKRFQTFIKKKMCSSVVRRLSIPECILLVTQRITKYPVLLQRLLQHTRDPEEEHADVAEALRQVKEVIAAVDTKVSDHEKKKRLKEVYNRTDSKSITRMKSGQMFAREDLIRGRSLLYDGTLQLKTAVGRLKDVQALLLSDVFVFLQEKDQKYIFASLDQRSTVVSLQKLIVREVANEERGLFLISAGTEIPEMVEVHASSKEERNTWIQLIQNAMTSIEKEDDEGIPSENEEDKRLQENRNREIRDQLQRKDEQILALLEEKMRLFRDLCDCPAADGAADQNRTLFRATRDVTKGESVMKEALKEVEVLQALVNSMLGTQQDSGVCVAPALPHRAETFAGFHSHQMNISKSKAVPYGEAVDESADLRRTESDGGLKKVRGGSANLLLPKRNREVVGSFILKSLFSLSLIASTSECLSSLRSAQHITGKSPSSSSLSLAFCILCVSSSFLHAHTHTHAQAVVVQQDSLIEEQRQTLRERLQVPSSSSSSSRPGSLIEQEKQRSLERHRQEAASLQRQRAAHSEERRRRESQWEERERELALREEQLHVLEQETRRKSTELEEEVQDLRTRKEEYQRDLARLRDNQRRLERDREQLDTEEQLEWRHRNPPTTPDSPLKSVVDATEPAELSSSPPTRDLLSRMDSKRKGKTLNPFVATSGQKGGAAELQGASRLLQLTKPKPKKEKKKKRSVLICDVNICDDNTLYERLLFHDGLWGVFANISSSVRAGVFSTLFSVQVKQPVWCSELDHAFVDRVVQGN
ncbi:hypothetical protein P4O66_020653, partial [Electrophorus voltai]